jgi:hypothetical protein
VAQHDILAQAFDVREATVHNSSNNVSTVWWQRKGTTSSSGPMARLLRLQALHQRHYQYIPLFDYIGGEANAMADDCSRLWHLSNSQLLAHFACHYPQSQPWMLCHLLKPMRCALILALSTNATGQELRNNATMQWKSIGRAGTHSAWPTMSTPTFTPGKTQSLCSKSSVNGIERDGWPPPQSHQS